MDDGIKALVSTSDSPPDFVESNRKDRRCNGFAASIKKDILKNTFFLFFLVLFLSRKKNNFVLFALQVIKFRKSPIFATIFRLVKDQDTSLFTGGQRKYLHYPEIVFKLVV